MFKPGDRVICLETTDGKIFKGWQGKNRSFV
jgi:hypothetical protein